MALPSQVGLGLLLCPLNSNVVVRTACCSVGLVIPVYSTFKAIENKDPSEQHRWLLYWAAYGSFSAAEMFAEKVLSWFPLYYHMKFAFLVWLQLPTINGARQLYASYLRPFLLKYQARLDLIVEFVYGGMSKFISAHQAELQFARNLAVKVLMTGVGVVPDGQTHAMGEHGLLQDPNSLRSASQMIRDIIRPVNRESKHIEGPKQQVQDAESERED